MEMRDDKQICRLCLVIIPTAEAEAIGEKKKALLKVLLINADLHVIENAVACSSCMEELQSGFEFKSACLHVDNCISTFVDADAAVPVDIKEVFHRENRDTVIANVNLENRQICRLCMSLIADEALDCNTSLEDIIANCFPEVNIHTVREPLVCGLCFSRMKKLNEFMTTCQGVERSINDYCQTSMDHSIPVSISLNDLLKFKESTINELIKEECSNFDTNTPKDLKKEDIASIKCEEIHIKAELESGGEMGDFGPSGACNHTEESGSLKWKRQISQFTSIERYEVLYKEFACQACTYKTDCMTNLTQHMVRHKDTEVEMRKCENCKFETRYKSSMINHMLKHSDPKAGRKFKCDKCPYETNYKNDLCRHNLRHKDKLEVEMHKCENCEYETRYKSSMRSHMLKHRDPKEGRKFKCDKCPYETNFKKDLCRHNLRHKDKLEVKIHKCKNCEYETRYKNNMIQHTITKHRDPKAERKFKCDKCPYKTIFKSNLHKHNLIHRDKSEVEMHKCENCDYETNHKGNLRQHMMKKHRDPKAERKLKCDKCPYETDFKSYLCQHSLIHKDKSEVEMHKCENCDYETKHKASMKQHMVKHLDPKADKKFKCVQCSYETDFNSNLHKHNLIHRDKSEVEIHKCENCEYETRHKGNMKQHMMRKHRDPKAERKF